MGFIVVSQLYAMLTGERARCFGRLELTNVGRWASNPIVKAAQMEKEIEFPVELELPWAYLQRMFGITSGGGNIMSIVLNNFDNNGQLAYSFTAGMPKIITNCDYTFCRLFFEIESMVRSWTPNRHNITKTKLV